MGIIAVVLSLSCLPDGGTIHGRCLRSLMASGPVIFNRGSVEPRVPRASANGSAAHQ